MVFLVLLRSVSTALLMSRSVSTRALAFHLRMCGEDALKPAPTRLPSILLSAAMALMLQAIHSGRFGCMSKHGLLLIPGHDGMPKERSLPSLLM